MTQLVTPKVLARTKAAVLILIVVALIQLAVGLSQVLVLQRVQRTQDDTKAILDTTIAAVQAGSPGAALTRTRLHVLCVADLGDACPVAPDPADVGPTIPPPRDDR